MFSWAEVWHKDFEAGSEYNFSLYYEKKKMLITFQTKEVNKKCTTKFRQCEWTSRKKVLEAVREHLP